MPKMGTKTRQAGRRRAGSLADALFSTTQQRVLGLLLGRPDRSFYATELIAAARVGSGAVQRELSWLEESGLVTVRRLGTQKHYQANPESPLFRELVAIAQKTVGLAEPLGKALAPVARQISAAFVYGSVAKGVDSARSDIDLLIVSDELGYAEVFALFEPLREALGRQVNPTVQTRREFNKRLKEGNAFLRRVMQQPKIWIIGSDNDIAA